VSKALSFQGTFRLSTLYIAPIELRTWIASRSCKHTTSSDLDWQTIERSTGKGQDVMIFPC
jgi:hypothetical protein